VLSQPAPNLGQPGILDVGRDPAADNLVPVGGDNQRRGVGPVKPREIGQILGCGRDPFNLPDFRYDTGPAQHVLGLLAELTILPGKYLEIQLVLRLRDWDSKLLLSHAKSIVFITEARQPIPGRAAPPPPPVSTDVSRCRPVEPTICASALTRVPPSTGVEGRACGLTAGQRPYGMCHNHSKRSRSTRMARPAERACEPAQRGRGSAAGILEASVYRPPAHPASPTLAGNGPCASLPSRSGCR